MPPRTRSNTVNQTNSANSSINTLKRKRGDNDAVAEASSDELNQESKKTSARHHKRRALNEENTADTSTSISGTNARPILQNGNFPAESSGDELNPQSSKEAATISKTTQNGLGDAEVGRKQPKQVLKLSYDPKTGEKPQKKAEVESQEEEAESQDEYAQEEPYNDHSEPHDENTELNSELRASKNENQKIAKVEAENKQLRIRNERLMSRKKLPRSILDIIGFMPDGVLYFGEVQGILMHLESDAGWAFSDLDKLNNPSTLKVLNDPKYEPCDDLKLLFPLLMGCDKYDEDCLAYLKIAATKAGDFLASILAAALVEWIYQVPGFPPTKVFELTNDLKEMTKSEIREDPECAEDWGRVRLLLGYKDLKREESNYEVILRQSAKDLTQRFQKMMKPFISMYSQHDQKGLAAKVHKLSLETHNNNLKIRLLQPTLRIYWPRRYDLIHCDYYRKHNDQLTKIERELILIRPGFVTEQNGQQEWAYMTCVMDNYDKAVPEVKLIEPAEAVSRQIPSKKSQVQSGGSGLDLGLGNHKGRNLRKATSIVDSNADDTDTQKIGQPSKVLQASNVATENSAKATDKVATLVEESSKGNLPEIPESVPKQNARKRRHDQDQSNNSSKSKPEKKKQKIVDAIADSQNDDSTDAGSLDSPKIAKPVSTVPKQNARKRKHDQDQSNNSSKSEPEKKKQKIADAIADSQNDDSTDAGSLDTPKIAKPVSKQSTTKRKKDQDDEGSELSDVPEDFDIEGPNPKAPNPKSKKRKQEHEQFPTGAPNRSTRSQSKGLTQTQLDVDETDADQTRPRKSQKTAVGSAPQAAESSNSKKIFLRLKPPKSTVPKSTVPTPNVRKCSNINCKREVPGTTKFTRDRCPSCYSYYSKHKFGSDRSESMIKTANARAESRNKKKNGGAHLENSNRQIAPMKKTATKRVGGRGTHAAPDGLSPNTDGEDDEVEKSANENAGKIGLNVHDRIEDEAEAASAQANAAAAGTEEPSKNRSRPHRAASRATAAPEDNSESEEDVGRKYKKPKHGKSKPSNDDESYVE